MLWIGILGQFKAQSHHPVPLHFNFGPCSACGYIAAPCFKTTKQTHFNGTVDMKPRFIHGENCPNNCNSLIIGIRCSVCWSHRYCQVQSNSKPHLHSFSPFLPKINQIQWIGWREQLYSEGKPCSPSCSHRFPRQVVRCFVLKSQYSIAFCYLSWLIPFFGMCFSTCQVPCWVGMNIQLLPAISMSRVPGLWSTSWGIII